MSGPNSRHSRRSGNAAGITLVMLGLMKLRETLLDEGQGVSVTLPPNIVIYPSQTAWCMGFCVTLFLALVGAVLVLAGFQP